jgi:hypothetical protein
MSRGNCAITGGATEPSTNSVDVEVEDGIGATCGKLGGVNRDEGEETGRVRPCMKVRTRDGEEACEDAGGDSTKWGGSNLALATISRPLSVIGEWLNGVKAT